MMMTKEQRERLQLECLTRNYTHFPAGAIICGDPPDPDFIVQNESGSIGIELTEFLLGSSPDLGSPVRRNESDHEGILSEACGLYAQRGLPAVSVRVSWLNHSPLKRLRRQQISHEIAEIAAANLPQPGFRVELENTGLPRSLVPEEMASITIAGFTRLNRNDWSAAAAGYVVSLKPKDIIEMISLKEPKLAGYKRICSDVWLVCVVEGFRPSSLAGPKLAVMDHVYETGFAKVLLLRCFEGRVLELKVAKRLQK
jgi:hypothetical protein